MATGQPELAQLASFAVELAMAARHETVGRCALDTQVEDKGEDGIFDPVTSADRAAEAAMRQLIADRFPEHGITGEELADKKSEGQLTWSLDPIDGTRSYICGLPSWTTLIALLEKGQPILGLIDAPALDELYLGTTNEAAIITSGERSIISTSGCTRLDQARFSTTDPYLFGPSTSLIQELVRIVRVTRYSLDGYAYARLAAGSIDLVIETGLKPHDYNALIPVIRAAGGYIGNWSGGDDFAAGNIIAAASRELYDEALGVVARA